jgi:hypothetical protein
MFFLVRAKRAYGGNSGADPLILDLGTRRRSVTNCDPRSLCLRERTQSANKQEAGEISQSFSAMQEREKSLSFGI